MSLYIGIALVVIALVIFVIALLRGQQKPMEEESHLDSDAAVQKAFEAIDGISSPEAYNNILLAQEDVEIRLAKLFDSLFASEQFNAAEKVASILVEYAPDISAGHFRSGLISLKKGRFEKAIEALKAALDIDPTDVRAANNLGYIYNFQKRYDDAVRVLEGALGENEENIVTMINLGIAYFHTNQLNAAFEILNSAFKRNQKIPEVHLYIGHCLKAFGEAEKAQIAYQRYLILSGKQEIPQEEPMAIQKEPNAEINKSSDSAKADEIIVQAKDLAG